MRLLLFIFFFGLCFCRSNTVTKISFTYKMPVRHSETEIELYSSTFYKTDYKDVIIYELPYWETFEKNNVLIKDTIKYSYFIFMESEQFGYFLDSLNSKIFKKKNIDSLLTKSALRSLNIDTVQSMVVNSTTEIINKNKFINKAKINEKGFDSVYFYYDNLLKDIHYDLSKKYDSLFKSKLFKVEYLLKKDTSQYASYVNNFRIISYEINRSKVLNLDELETVYQRFKKEGK